MNSNESDFRYGNYATYYDKYVVYYDNYVTYCYHNIFIDRIGVYVYKAGSKRASSIPPLLLDQYS